MVAQHYRWDFIGLSTDEKPTPDTSDRVVDGSTFYCSDTSKLYVYCKDNWYERKSLGGGGGGTSYTAGTGIDITEDTISVDTDTIQEKLTAGTNITIADNVISASGGGSVTPVQTTGTSTTDVMSQDATTKMIFPDIADFPGKVAINSDISADTGLAINGSIETSRGYNITISSHPNLPARIGSGARTDNIVIGNDAGVYTGGGNIAIGQNANGSGSINTPWNVVIGYSSTAQTKNHCVALGSEAQCTRDGEVNIGTGSNNNGYNSTNYRVIGGVHDGQLAQDAVTVAQVNATIDAINTALSTSIPHIGASS